MTPENFEKVKPTIKEFFEKTGFDLEIEILPSKNSTILVNLKTKDPQILIGPNGQTLFEIQHILKTILKRKIDEDFYIDLDVNNYKKKKIEYLKELAKSVANEVALTKKEKELEPMPPYERRIIHLELANRSDVTTQSIGEEPNRRVVVKPYP